LITKGTPDPTLDELIGVIVAVPGVVSRLAATVARIVVAFRYTTGRSVSVAPKFQRSVVPGVSDTGSNGRKLLPVTMIVCVGAPAVVDEGASVEITGVGCA
jgi:hypothetical protein